MAVYRTKFTREKCRASLKSNGDTNKAHSNPVYARRLVDSFDIKFRESSQGFAESLGEALCFGPVLDALGLRPHLPIVPGILEVFEAKKFVKIEAGENSNGGPVFDYIEARFYFPILQDSDATVEVLPLDKGDGYFGLVNVPYNSFDDKPALEARFERGRSFSERADEIEILSTGKGLPSKRVLVEKSFELTLEAEQEFYHSLGREAYPTDSQLILSLVPPLLINSLVEYKTSLGEAHDEDSSVFLYNKQQVWFNNSSASIPFHEPLRFVAAVSRKGKDGRYVYDAELAIFLQDGTLAMYAESGAVEKVI